jgi:hypothetical protein
VISAREDISVAAFKLLKTIPQEVGVQTFSRRYVSSADLGAVQMPAVFFLVKAEHAQPPMHGLQRWKMDAYIFAFISTNDVDSEPETQLNVILDAIEKAIAPDSTGKQTLGGLVYDFRINGTIERDPGFISGVGAAAVPIEITTTS